MIRALFLLFFFASVAHADTIPATVTTVPKVNSYYEPNSLITGTSRAEICTALLPWVKQNLNSEMTRSYMSTDTICDVTDDVNYRYRYGIFEKQICPSDSKLNTSTGLCEKYTCPSDYILDSNGTTCTANKCKKDHRNGWVSYKGSFSGGDVCIDGCAYEQMRSLFSGDSDLQDDRVGTDGRTWAYVGQYGKGTACTDSNGQTPENKNDQAKKPPCDASEGVLTTSTGKVLCVPEGTPDKRVPVVDKKKKIESFPDNTTKESETIKTTDPVTKASDTTTIITSTGGQSGTAGTTTSSESNSKSGGGSGTGSGTGSGDGSCEGSNCGLGLGPKGKFGDRQSEIDAARGELSSLINSIKAEVSAMFGELSGSGALPCPPSVQILGRSFSVCASGYEDQLSKIGAIVILAATVLAAFIVLKR